MRRIILAACALVEAVVTAAILGIAGALSVAAFVVILPVTLIGDWYFATSEPHTAERSSDREPTRGDVGMS